MTEMEWGYFELRPYLVGRRYIPPGNCFLPAWKDITPGSMELARIEYDRGQAEMVQARWHDPSGRLWWLQYAIPRKERRHIHLNYFGTRGHA